MHGLHVFLRRITQWTPPEQNNPTIGEYKVERPEQQAPMQVIQPNITGPARPIGIGVNVAGYGMGNPGYGVEPMGGVSQTSGPRLTPMGPNERGRIGLPGYIEIRVNAADGRTYYVNHRTQVTSWTPPPREDW